MVTIQRLYERLEELVATADMAVEEFAASGDLTQLQTDLVTVGAEGYQLASNVNDIARAIAGSSEAVDPSF